MTFCCLQKVRHIGEVGRVIFAVRVLEVKVKIINIFCYWLFKPEQFIAQLND